jgi:hypothetical protein
LKNIYKNFYQELKQQNKTMKKIFFIAIFLFAFGNCYSQLFMIGPRAGVSSSTINFKEFTDPAGNLIKPGDARLGFHAGIVSRITIMGFYVQPEVLFTNAGGEIIESGGNVPDQVLNYNFNRLDVPVLLGYKFANIFRVQAGPSFSYLLSSDIRNETGTQVYNVAENYNQATVGYRAGIGLDIWKILIDLKHEGSLGRFGSTISGPGGQTFSTDQRQSQWILSVGFKLFDLL